MLSHFPVKRVNFVRPVVNQMHLGVQITLVKGCIWRFFLLPLELEDMQWTSLVEENIFDVLGPLSHPLKMFCHFRSYSADLVPYFSHHFRRFAASSAYSFPGAPSSSFVSDLRCHTRDPAQVFPTFRLLPPSGRLSAPAAKRLLEQMKSRKPRSLG